MKKVVPFILFFAAIISYGQNHHFSLYTQKSLVINAMQAGNFDGDYRIGGNFRSQWAGIVTPFRTTAIFAELKKNRFGFGLHFLNNNAGDASIKTNTSLFTFAYHQPLNNKGGQLSFATQFGLLQHSFSPENFSFSDQFLATGNPTNIAATTEYFSRTNRIQPNLNIGLQLTAPVNDKITLIGALQLNNINKPNVSFSDKKVNKPIMIITSGQANVKITDKIGLETRALYAQANTDKRALAGASFVYSFDASTTFKLGMDYRVKEALVLQTALNYLNYDIGLSYDITTSKLANNTSTKGAFELFFAATFGKKLRNDFSDRDKDGINDELDQCPDEPGITKFYGCPDSDFDGLPNSQDDCPFVYGPIKNNGCPIDNSNKNNEEPVKIIERIIEKPVEIYVDRPVENGNTNDFKAIVEFDTDKYNIKQQYYPILDQLVYYIQFNKNLLVRLDGHTDHEGNDQYNYVLGMNRAQAVIYYLVKKGVPMQNIIINSYGKFMPKAENTTTDGKQRNRRVEIELIEKK